MTPIYKNLFLRGAKELRISPYNFLLPVSLPLFRRVPASYIHAPLCKSSFLRGFFVFVGAIRFLYQGRGDGKLIFVHVGNYNRMNGRQLQVAL